MAETFDYKIRNATKDDAEKLLEIYAYYVKKTAITYEYEVPSVEEFKRRIEAVSQKYPWLVACDSSGGILGYAYAGVFKDRRAYDWSVETTVYVRKGLLKKGLGKALYSALEEKLKEMGITNMYACVACTQNEDEYLTNNSVGFHTHVGFKKCGEFSRCAKKFDRWYDMCWLEKIILPH